MPAVDTRRVLDDIRMVSSLAERMPADIIGYGEKMRENSRALFTTGIDAEHGSHADVLNRMFDGHDALADSDEGKAFDTFYTLIADHRLREDLESSIARIATGLPNLPPDLLDTLTGFIDRMWDEVQAVDEVRGQVYRRINTFVKDGDFLHYRALRAQIADAQRAAMAAFVEAGPGRDMGIEVPMSAAVTNSVGALVVPRRHRRVTGRGGRHRRRDQHQPRRSGGRGVDRLAFADRCGQRGTRWRSGRHRRGAGPVAESPDR